MNFSIFIKNPYFGVVHKAPKPLTFNLSYQFIFSLTFIKAWVMLKMYWQCIKIEESTE